ncbi:cadherin-89D-like, partial [Limulus polyphemus]|uniref:Cadherin-89D-like n=1 Tax=Limulus polyphemus TaxID=6850 RepID=A0ABM1BFQ6_LIMPO
VTKISAIDADLGENGLVFYQLGEGHKNRFYIDSKDGTVWTLSKLDYEQQRFYNMTVIAYDHGTPTQSATVKLWVTVTDTNDVVPEFQKSVYTLEVAESTKAGEVVFKLDAGSGNFQYKLLNDQDVDTFSIDEETGEVFVSKPLDSIHRSHYRLLVSAKDNSDPPKVDKTELNIIVGAGTGVRLFPSRLYEVTVQENKVAPLPVLDLNTTDEIAQKPVQYSIVEQDINGLFTIEAQTGLLVLTATLDREQRSKFFLKIRAEDFALKRYGRSVGLRQLESYYLAYDETLVLVTVGDENDNVPVFENGAQPVIAAVPLEATYGFEITRVKAIDADIAYNAAIRYEIIQKDKDASSKFHIDPVTGIIRSMVTFSLDRERAFGFDVKATDREGSSNGHSALTNVFIYVLPETKLVVIVTDTHPLVMEQHMGQVLSYLSNMTGYEVQVAKLESHHEGDVEHPESSDLFLYGINRETNDILDTEILLKILGKQSDTITNDLSHLRIRRIQEVSVHAKISQMGTTEIAIIALSSVIFLGGVLGIALLCSSCKKRKMKKGHATWEQQRLYNIKNTLMNKSPYGGRISDGSAAPLSPSYTDGTSNTKSPDSVGDRSSIEKNYKDSRQQVPPDGASSHTRSRSPRYDGFNKRNNQWDLRKDENDSFGTRFSHGSAFNSWSSRYSHTSRSKQATDF